MKCARNVLAHRCAVATERTESSDPTVGCSGWLSAAPMVASWPSQPPQPWSPHGSSPPHSPDHSMRWADAALPSRHFRPITASLLLPRSTGTHVPPTPRRRRRRRHRRRRRYTQHTSASSLAAACTRAYRGGNVAACSARRSSRLRPPRAVGAPSSPPPRAWPPHPAHRRSPSL